MTVKTFHWVGLGWVGLVWIGLGWVGVARAVARVNGRVGEWVVGLDPLVVTLPRPSLTFPRQATWN